MPATMPATVRCLDGTRKPGHLLVFEPGILIEARQPISPGKVEIGAPEIDMNAATDRNREIGNPAHQV
jgi:hypothetical protein